MRAKTELAYEDRVSHYEIPPGSQRDIENKIDFVGKLKRSKISVPKSNNSKRKITEGRNFNERWTNIYFFVPNKNKAACLICNGVITQKEYNVKRHFKSCDKEFKQLSGEVRNQKIATLKRNLSHQQSVFVNLQDASKSAVRASFYVAQFIGESDRPFTDREFVKKCLIKVVQETCPDKLRCIKDVSLSASTITRRVVDIGEHLHETLKESAKFYKYFSLAIDESNDTTDTVQLLIFIRGEDAKFRITEELCSLGSLKSTTTAENIFSGVTTALSSLGLSWKNLKTITTDGARNIVGKKKGVSALMNEKVREANGGQPMQFHCIIHQQAVCGKVLNWRHVMSVVVSNVNFIKNHALNHHQFQTFLADLDCEYRDVMYHNEVCWLSRGKVLRRFFQLRKEINEFLKEKKKEEADLIADPRWLRELAFLSDITEHLNILYVKLKGKENLISDMFAILKEFLSKFDLFKNQIAKGNFTHFNNGKTLTSDNETGLGFDLEKYTEALETLQSEFANSFCDFQKYETVVRLFENPFAGLPTNVDSWFQLELIELLASIFKVARFAQGVRNSRVLFTNS